MSEDTSHCPKCGADWDAGPIPENVREHYGTLTRYSRLIGVEIQGQDRLDHWECPDCHAEFPR